MTTAPAEAEAVAGAAPDAVRPSPDAPDAGPAHAPAPLRPVELPVELPGRARVWAIPVPDNAGAARARLHELEREERARAARLRRPDDAARFLVAHVGLRELLARRLGTDPGRLVVEREPCAGCGRPHGRPHLPGDPVHFSLSHSGDLVLVALAPVPVGVDVEAVRPPAPAAHPAGALHRAEQAELLALPHRERAAAFARCWTRKEAVLKSTGRGLLDGAAFPYVGTGSDPVQPHGHHVRDLPVAEGFAAALALHPGPVPSAAPRSVRSPGASPKSPPREPSPTEGVHP
ncbi:4'-phosphopantetheinyl transferase superfamily protein [Streptomyces sp. NPDC048606]|uniref:4'-phosphopantetheinyl transferase family protein n=1 Tax=Streptomyces sp. NPDC048606 TaxID=3154726 RepID=UPI00344716D1